MHKAISLAAAVEKIPDGASLMIGGFMGIGSPHRLIGELVRQGRKNLTVIANDTGVPGFGIGHLIAAKLIKKLVATHIGLNPETQRQMIAGEISVDHAIGIDVDGYWGAAIAAIVGIGGGILTLALCYRPAPVEASTS